VGTLGDIGTLLLGVAAIGGQAVVWLQSRQNGRSIRDVHGSVAQVGASVNGQTHELIRATQTIARAQGNLEGRAEQIAEESRSDHTGT
jgi:hypothetical protein